MYHSKTSSQISISTILSIRSCTPSYPTLTASNYSYPSPSPTSILNPPSLSPRASFETKKERKRTERLPSSAFPWSTVHPIPSAEDMDQGRILQRPASKAEGGALLDRVPGNQIGHQ
ncbi:hypothetical protein RRG08_057100 [Elysia crispata]|uniref:Uncharacterized protein n=1 Tax=Elysia crispata TaxID=231223 RepID=A0AAE1ALP7_9GAST|nr:hypothetical protein RRG08_057100 [Elysia crispata]